MSSDADLVRRCLDGDRVGWAELLGRYADLLYALLHRYGLDRTTAADGFQEVSILLWRNLKRLRSAESLVPWLATTTKRVAWRLKARSRTRAGRDAEVARPDVDRAEAPDVAVEALEAEQAVRRALSGLGERCRRLLSALYFQSTLASYDEIAERLGMPRGSIGPTRQRCLEGLRKELTALGFAPDGVSGGEGAASVPAGGTAKAPPPGRRGTP